MEGAVEQGKRGGRRAPMVGIKRLNKLTHFRVLVEKISVSNYLCIQVPFYKEVTKLAKASFVAHL